MAKPVSKCMFCQQEGVLPEETDSGFSRQQEGVLPEETDSGFTLPGDF